MWVRCKSKACRELLRKPCDGQNVFGNACTGGATTKKYFLRLAPSVQEPKSSFWGLHHRCKRQKEVFEVCTAGASVSKNTLTVTARYPRHSSGIRNLIHSSNSRKYKQGWKEVHPMLLSLLSYTFCWKRTRVFPQKGILLRYEIYSNATKLEGTPTAVTMGVCEHSPVLVL